MSVDSLRRAATAALSNNRITRDEVRSLFNAVRASGIDAAERAELQKIFSTHETKFTAAARNEFTRLFGDAPQPPPAPLSLNRDVADPPVLTKHNTDTTWKPVQDGKLFVDGISYDDVVSRRSLTRTLTSSRTPFRTTVTIPSLYASSRSWIPGRQAAAAR